MIWINAAAKYILDQGGEEQGFVTDRVNESEAYRAILEPFNLDYAFRRTRLSIDQIKTVAEEIAKAERVCALWAMGVTQHIAGTAISNLLLLTGNFGKPGTGGYPLRGHNKCTGLVRFRRAFQ